MINKIKMMFLVNIYLIMTNPKLFSQPDKSKRAERMLELAILSLFRLRYKLTLKPILGCFHGLDESQRCSPYPELFSQPDKSKRAKKMLELAILSIFRLR
jgi:hypothetical protein